MSVNSTVYVAVFSPGPFIIVAPWPKQYLDSKVIV